MSISILSAVDVIVNLLIILFLMKCLIEPREFYFNSALKPVDAITSPLLKIFEKFIPKLQITANPESLFAIVFILVFKAIIYFLVLHVGFVLPLIIVIIKAIEFYIQLLAFSLFVCFIIPPYNQNSLVQFWVDILFSISNFFRSFLKSRSQRILVTFFVIFIFLSLLWLFLFLSIFENQLVQSVDSSNLGIINNVINLDFLNLVVKAHSMIRQIALSFLYFLVLTLSVYRYIIILLIVSALITWVSLDVRNPLINAVFSLTEPILTPLRRVIPTLANIDLSPLVAIVLISLLANGILIFLSRLSISIAGM